MPWREAARPSSSSYIADPNIRGYSCLVSEVMLQQTQVLRYVGKKSSFNNLPRQGGHSDRVLQEVDGQVANCAALGQFFPRGGAGGLVWSWILLEVDKNLI